MHAIQDGITLIVVVLIQAKNVVNALNVAMEDFTQTDAVLQTMLIVDFVKRVLKLISTICALAQTIKEHAKTVSVLLIVAPLAIDQGAAYHLLARVLPARAIKANINLAVVV